MAKVKIKVVHETTVDTGDIPPYALVAYLDAGGDDGADGCSVWEALPELKLVSVSAED